MVYANMLIVMSQTLIQTPMVKGCRLTVVVGDDMQAVEQLPLVLMDSLDLDVKHGVGVDLHLVVLLQVRCELQLVFLHQQHR